jgi:hypothetical protein
MKSKFSLSAISAAFLLLSPFAAAAQDNGSVKDLKFEAATEFTTMTFEPGQTILGLGTRLTYNINSHFALEAATYVFPHDCQFCGRHSGRTVEGLFGVKIGKRFNKWGIFGKVRPGVISSSEGQSDLVVGIPTTSPPSIFQPSLTFIPKRLTSFAADVGGVVEYYPSKRIITRLDFGETIIHYSRKTTNFPVFDPATGGFVLRPSTVPAQNRGALQFMAGVGFRF